MPVANRNPGNNFKGNHSKQRFLAWIPAFLRAMSEGVTVAEACRVAGTHTSTVYNHRAADEDFRACWDRAVNRGTELLEQEAVRRAYHGVEKPVFYKGEQCGSVQEYSDGLLMFMLKARRPEVYRDKEPRGDTVVHGNLSVQTNVLAASAIREMIANGELGGTPNLLTDSRATAVVADFEGGNQGERASAVPGAPGASGLAGEVIEPTPPPAHRPDPGLGMADSE